MQFTFTEEQQEFRVGAAAVLRARARRPPTVRRLMETEAGWDAAQWRELNQQLGLCGVHVPEQFGGQGFSFVELGIVLEEMGRALVCAPYFASAVLAATAIMNAATEAQKTALLPPHRLRRDHRHARLHRAERALGRGRRRDHRDAGRRQVHGSTASRASCSTAHTADLVLVLARAPGSSRRGRPLALHGARRCAGPHPHAAEGARSDAQARAAGVRGRSRPS